MTSAESWGDLELFESSGVKIGTPTITILSTKTINLSSGFFHSAKEELSNNNYVELRYSKSKNAIVFCFTAEANNKSSMKLTRSTNSSNGSIAARSFLNYYNISSHGKYTAKKEDIPNIGIAWVIYLTENLF